MLTLDQASQAGYHGVMPVQLSGGLAARTDQPLGDACPLDRTVRLIGSRPALLLLREAFYGARRFDDLARRVGVTDAGLVHRRLVT